MFVEEVFDDKNFMSFEQTMVKYKIPKKDFWKYIQLRNLVKFMERKISLVSQTVMSGNGPG